MSKFTSIKAAILSWEKKETALLKEKSDGASDVKVKAQQAKEIRLMCQIPPIGKMDNKLNELLECEHLSLATNSIDKIIALPALKKLKTLALGRNNIKKIEKIDDLGNLENLWLSYNQIEKLNGLENMSKLRVLYISNNKIKDFDELLKLANLPELKEVLLVGNPIYSQVEEPRIEVVKRMPNLMKLDGVMVSAEEKAQAAEVVEE